MPGELARQIQLVTELADVADAMGSHLAHTDLDRALGCERKCRIRDVVAGKGLQNAPSPRPHHSETRLAARHVDCRTARLLGDVTLEPSDIAAKRGGTRYDEKRRVRKACHRDVGLDAAAIIKPLRVNDTAGGDCDIVGTEALQNGLRIRSLHADLAEGAHVEE